VRRRNVQEDGDREAHAGGAFKQHKLEHKHPKRRRHSRKNKLIAKADAATIRVLVPYL